MTIIDDQIKFAAEDFDGLSDFSKKALTAYIGDYAAYFSVQANRDVEISKLHLKKIAGSDPVTDAILAGLASADEAKLAEAAPILASLDALLNPKK